MHEYLHKYFENIKKLEKNFPIHNMRPLSNVSPLPAEGVRGGGSSSGSDKFVNDHNASENPLCKVCSNFVY